MAAKFFSVYALSISCLLHTTQASPVPAGPVAGAQSAKNSLLSSSSSLGRLPHIDVVTTSTTTTGDVLDWIDFDSQGEVADPPPFAPLVVQPVKTVSTNGSDALLDPASQSLNSSQATRRALVKYSASAGKSSGRRLGIVPIMRFKTGIQPVKRSPQSITQIQQQNQALLQNTKTPAKAASKPVRLLRRILELIGRRQSTNYAGSHWYVTSNYGIVSKGARALFSAFKPYVRPEDFSLLQLAVGRTGLASGLQTVEAGYQYYPAFKNTPRIFTYFNTNGYSSSGDNVGGYDTTVKGWVQSSSNYYPGIAVSNYSTFGGVQQELNIQYLLYNGNWWLWIQSEWAGYYPGSLFSANQANASETLAASGDQVFFYGEVAQGGSALTTTDMGSGKSAMTGYKQSAYIRNMQYCGSNGQYLAYPASSVDFYDSDSSRYNHSYVAPGSNNWASYVYLGGYGAGKVTGA